MREHIEHVLRFRQPGVLGRENMVQAAVAVPLAECDGKLHVLFEVRAKHLHRQPGEICFPGGRLEPGDRHPADAAVRETCEELGLSPGDVQLLGPLDVLVNPWRTVIYPFVCQVDPSRIRINPEEVDEVFYVPLDDLWNSRPEVYHVHLRVEPEESFPFERIPGGRGYRWSRGTAPEYFFTHKGYVIWGLTGRILKHFLDLTNPRSPSDPPREAEFEGPP
ncbi:MAG: CoA pyrophosphatase [Alicyclobacillaceae bacterium]|nr:CoA pyrophosphatase [Alicyclobacillaceae bacterium]